MLFLLFIFLQIKLGSFSPSDTIWKKTLEYITEGKMKVFEGRNFFVFDESNYTSLDINDSKMEILYQKQKELYTNYRIPNYIFAVDNHNENSESLTEATHNLAAYLNNEFNIDKNKTVIAYLSIQSRRIKIRTGEIIRKNITDSDAENMINNLKPYLQKKSYYEAWIKFVDDINYYRDDNLKVINNNTKSSSKKSKKGLLIFIIIIGSIIVLIIIIVICRKCSCNFSNPPYNINSTYNNDYSINNKNISDISTFLKDNRNNQNIFIDYCAICLEKFNNADPHSMTTYICGHIFHNKCISNLKIVGCPICRQRLNPQFNQENSKIIWGIQLEKNNELKKYDFNELFMEKKNIENKDAISIDKNNTNYKVDSPKASSYNYYNNNKEESNHTYSYGNRDDNSGIDGYSPGASGCSGGASGGSGGASGGW